MKVLCVMAAMAVACIIPIQAIINGRLGQVLENPFLAALVSFVGGVLILGSVVLISSGGLPTVPDTGALPWYLFTGGLFGALFVTTVLVITPQIGTANVLSATVVGQLVMALVVDHFGLLGMPQITLSVSRVVGCGLLILGMLLIQSG